MAMPADQRSNRLKICAVIPAYNEAPTVGAVVQETREYVDTVFVVDDGSSDDTAEIARQSGAEVIRHQANHGMGEALWTGYQAAISRGFDIAVQLDGDQQHDPRYIAEMLAVIKDCDIVIGSRFLNQSHRQYPLVRRIGIAFFTSLVNMLGRLRITDVTSGYRMFKVSSLQQMAPCLYRHWAVAQTLEAGRKGLKIKEVSVEMPLRRTGRSQFTLAVYALYSLKVLWIILKVMLSRERGGRLQKRSQADVGSAGLMKICVVRQPSPKPETHVHTLSLLRVLQPLAEKIYLITGNFPEEAIPDSKLQIINVGSRGYYRSKVLELAKPVAIIQVLLTDLEFAYRLLRLSRKINVVIFFVAMTFPLTMLLSKLLGKRVIFIVTGSARRSAEKVPMKDPLGIGSWVVPRLVGLLESMNFLLANKIVVELEDAIRWLGIARYRHKIAIGRFLIDTDLFRIERPYEARENIIGYLGSSIEAKGVVNLSQAIPAVLETRQDLKFLLGGGGPLFTEIATELKKNGLADKVTLLEWIPHEQVKDYLNQLRLLVMPSYTEGGVQAVALEAMACGTPVLTTAVGGITELVKDGENGFILENASSEHIAQRIVRALEHPRLNEIREKARQLVRDEYSYEAVVKRYREILYGNSEER